MTLPYIKNATPKFNFRLKCTYKPISSLNADFHGFRNKIWKLWYGGCASFSSTTISSIVRFKIWIFYCSFHPVFCKPLVISQYSWGIIMVWAEEPQLFYILYIWNLLWRKLLLIFKNWEGTAVYILSSLFYKDEWKW